MPGPVSQSMPLRGGTKGSKRIPWKALEDFAKSYGQKMAILFCSDGETQHVVTWAQRIEDSSRAADLGNKIKDGIGWPKSLHSQPSRVRKLQARIKELEELNKGLREVIEARTEDRK